MMALAVGRAFAFRTRRAWLLLGNPMLWIALAGVVMLVGIVVRQRAVRFLGAFFRTHVTLLDDHRLITDAPYARLRPPQRHRRADVVCCGRKRVRQRGLAAGDAGPPVRRLCLSHPGRGARAEAHFGDAWRRYRAGTAALIPFVW